MNEPSRGQLLLFILLGVTELQGGVDVYEVRVESSTFSNVYTYGPEVTKATITDLQPSTQYEVRVTIVVHGGATISSDSQYVTTLDGGKPTSKRALRAGVKDV